jgi:cellulose synthase operon protein C
MSPHRVLAASAELLTLCLAFVCAWAALACGPQQAQPPRVQASVQPAPDLPVEFAGCAVLYTGLRCELAEDRRLTFWLAVSDAKVATSTGALSWDAQLNVGGGAQYRVTVPLRTPWLEVSAGPAHASFRLSTLDHVPTPVLDEASALRSQGKLTEARALLSALPVAQQARARAWLARIALSAGDYATAVTGLRASSEEAFALGRLSDAVNDATAAAYVLTLNVHDYAAARAVLDRADVFAATAPESAAILPHYRGLLAMETGALRDALALFRLAATRTERLALQEHQWLARKNANRALASLGRYEEAMATASQSIVRMKHLDPCRDVDAREQLLWIAILAAAPSNSAIARQAASAATDIEAKLLTCHSEWRVRNHFINVGLLAAIQADAARSSQALQSLAVLPPTHDVSLSAWELELRGRVALLQHEPKAALQHFSLALAQSQRAGLWDNEHLAQLGIGRSQEALGKGQRALDAYAAADELLDRLLGAVPLSEGEAGFLRERESGTRQRIALLVALKRPADAFDVARRARARVLESVAYPSRLARLTPVDRARFEAALARFHGERSQLEKDAANAWSLPQDELAAANEALAQHRAAAFAALDDAHAILQGGRATQQRILPSPPAGTALLGHYPVADGVIGFVARSSGVVARKLAPLDLTASPDAIAGALLAPFERELNDVQRINVLMDGELAVVDVHALLWKGAPVLARWPVAYGLDAPTVQRAAVTDERAVIVADPTGDLPESAREGDRVQRLQGDHPVTFMQGALATRASVLQALATATLFHYAGHGEMTGVDGIESGLRLADGSLSVGDILTLTHAPRLVVLSACDAARTRNDGLSNGLNVAQAFVAAGAEAVIAPTRPVADTFARALMEAFYAARMADPAHDPANALRTAQLALHAQQPAADWSSFRLWVP